MLCPTMLHYTFLWTNTSNLCCPIWECIILDCVLACGTVFDSRVWYDMVWYGMIWYHLYGEMLYGVIWYYTVLYYIIWTCIGLSHVLLFSATYTTLPRASTSMPSRLHLITKPELTPWRSPVRKMPHAHHLFWGKTFRLACSLQLVVVCKWSFEDSKS